MKKLLKLTLMLFMVTAVFTACSKDDDPANNSFFVGTYNGSVSYNSGSTSISKDAGSVRVVKVGNKYNFNFSDAIPSINGVEFTEDANSAVSIGSTESKYIRIDEGVLKIAFNKDGETWTANCTR